ncbi:queuine tRNA-ribosyltransferase accessory subunit 2 isoform X2 [Agrilus planipennis]|uniref:Queuine tRNA-ribosyltransferase accessory subunit 2 n=1 Tax=Agrilus planipennis TaxID=224129 RepID=A0A7F5RN60_AGRPL|nr:queuine tRNA-ribosyltransferase accessory subunit 2 isoform X2 [Agrilus planipennis]
MKFSVKTSVKSAPRLGKLYCSNDSPSSFRFQTPMGGSLPHITHEVFKMISKNQEIIQIPLTSTYSFHQAMSQFEGNIASFVGMKDCLSYMTVQDPGELTQSGHHVKDNIPIWTRGGKVMINADKYMDLIENYKPDMYCMLTDSDTNVASLNKRIIKSVDNTIKFYNKCMERHTKSEILKDTFVIASVTGGYSIRERKRCLDAVTSNENVGGYVIDGLHNNGPEVEFIPFDEVKPVVKYVTENLPVDKVRIVQGCWNPLMVLHLVGCGIDIFDTSYCYIVTERSAALTFSLGTDDKLQKFEINLRESQYADDFKPILPNCTCLACTKHTRGYIHHLLAVQELLGPILLTIHNVHHYLRFFEKIRECIKENTLPEYQTKIAKEFREFEKKISSRTSSDTSVIAAES